MGGIVKCINQCRKNGCAPTLHLRTLNPHLEHAAFDAVFETEPAAFAYPTGNCQVSSFGFGGTNAHGIFWGKSMDVNQDVEKLWMRKLLSRPPPEVRPMGQNYDDWEADFPDTRAMRQGVKFSLSIGPDEGNEPLRWDIVDDRQAEIEEMEATFAVVGNFNGWDAEEAVPMEDAEVPGVHRITLEVPLGGKLEFHLLKGGTADQVVCPEQDDCTRKAVQIIGPEKDLKNKWVINAQEGKQVRIELFNRAGRTTIMWIIQRDGADATNNIMGDTGDEE